MMAVTPSMDILEVVEPTKEMKAEVSLGREFDGVSAFCKVLLTESVVNSLAIMIVDASRHVAKCKFG